MSKHCIIAVSPNSWGRGATVEEAKAQLVKAGGRASGCHLRFVYGDDKAYVNEMGDLYILRTAESFNIGGRSHALSKRKSPSQLGSVMTFSSPGCSLNSERLD